MTSPGAGNSNSFLELEMAGLGCLVGYVCQPRAILPVSFQVTVCPGLALAGSKEALRGPGTARSNSEFSDAAWAPGRRAQQATTIAASGVSRAIRLSMVHVTLLSGSLRCIH